VPAQKLKH